MLPVKMNVFGPALAEGDWKETRASRIATKEEVMLIVCAAAKAAVGMLKVFPGLDMPPAVMWAP